MSNPITRKEKLLKSIANGENPQISPITREEQYLSFIAGSGNSIPDHPITREEIYLDKIARQGISGGGGTSAILVEKTITENGEYPAVNDGADGYSKVVVNVASGGGDTDNMLDAVIEGTATEVVLPNATKIKKYAFYQDQTIRSVEMPKVTSIERNAFYSCGKLALTELPSGITRIGDYAFRDCANLTTLTFKGKPTHISSNAFYECWNLKTLNVPWTEGEVANAPWGATNATINYNYTGE